jgi:hypothetical protein
MLVSLSEMVCIVRRRRRAMGSQGGGGCIVRKEGDNKRAWLHFYLLASPVQSFQVNRVGNYKITTEEKIINWRIRISNLVSTSHYGHWLISTRGRTNSSVTTSRFFLCLGHVSLSAVARCLYRINRSNWGEICLTDLTDRDGSSSVRVGVSDPQKG